MQLKDIAPGSLVKLATGETGIFQGVPLEVLPFGAGIMETDGGKEVLVHGQDEATVLKGVIFSGANKTMLAKAEAVLRVAISLFELSGYIQTAAIISRYADEIKDTLTDEVTP